MSVRAVIAGHISHLFTDVDDDGDVGDDAGDVDADDDVCADIADELDIDEAGGDVDGEEDYVGEQSDDSDNAESYRSATTAVDESAYNEEDMAILRQMRASMPNVDGSVVISQHRKRSKNGVNFGINAVLDKIEVPLYGPSDWLWNRDAAHTVCDEDAMTKQYILSCTSQQSRTVPPLRGAQNRVTPPATLGEIYFDRWMLHTTPKLYTTNVVSTFHLGVPVSLSCLVHRTLGVCFNPRCFAAAKLRCSKGTHLIFSGGSVVCAGANSVQMSRIAARDCTLLLTRVGIQAEVSKFTVQNVVSTADAGFPVHLCELAAAYPINAHFDPECFPGLMFRLSTSQLVFIVFESGKCIITGVSSRQQSLVAWRWFHSRVLWEFEKSTGTHESAADNHKHRRQQSSMITSMCDLVRDITTANLSLMLGADAVPEESSRPPHESLPERPSLEDWLEFVADGKAV